MKTFTVFCSEADGQGTMWIDTVEANLPTEAMDLGLAKCLENWGDEYGPDDVVVRGVAEGSVNILYWEDNC